MTEHRQGAVRAADIDGRTGSTYPARFRSDVAGRTKRVLGDRFGLSDFGVNHVTLSPGAWSSQRHWHTQEDELVFVLSGELMLVTNDGETPLTSGMVAGFPKGVENGHHLVNRSQADAVYVEIGARREGDECFYPDIDLQLVSDDRGGRHFTTRAGTPYDAD